MQPDQDTIANGRKSFLSEIKGLFVQLLLIAHEVGAFNLGNVSMDGSKIQADASKSKTVSYQRLLEIESRWLQEVSGLLESGELADRGEKLPSGLIINEDIERRQEGLASLSEAKAVMTARDEKRSADEAATEVEKLRTGEEKGALQGVS